uniref:RNA helicase n=1 Tax=Timema cristinae TaxID=61476 RepID=A0A7R9GQ78_TIMCR|nr:unnamed protein product [Timema cristinae]
MDQDILYNSSMGFVQNCKTNIFGKDLSSKEKIEEWRKRNSDVESQGFVQNCKTNIFGKDLSSKEKIEEWRKRNSDVESQSVGQNVSRSRIKLAEVASSLQAEETCSFQPSLSFAYASPKPDLNINQHMNLLDILKSKDNSSLSKTSHDSVPGSQSLLILENLLSNLPRGRSSSRNSNASSGVGTVHSRSKITDVQENNIVQTSKTDDEALSYVAVEKSTDDETLGSETSSKQSMVDPAFHSRLDTFKFVERHTLNRVLAHGQFMAKPLQGLEHANFPSQIHKALQKVGFQSLMSIQSYTFVSILRGQNVFIVGPPRSGKTLSYLLPLLSNCVTGETFQNLKPGCGPFILILCPGHKSAQFIYNASCKLLRLAGVSNVDVMITYGGGDELEKMITLMNGCHILISTPRRFLKLAKTSSHIVSLNRVCHLVLEEADTLTTKCAVEVKGIVESCKQISKKRDIPTQMVFVSEMWTPTIEFLADRVAENSSVCIGSCLEAAVYAKLKPNLHFVEPLIKDNKLIEVLGSNSNIIKTIIVCQTAKEVIHVVTLLESFNFITLGVHEKKFHFVTTELITEWKHSKSGCYSVLVCSDDVLLELKIMDAMKLIHYDLPTNSKTQFGYRFSCLMDNYRNIFQQLDEDRLECSVHIFVDINDVHQFPSVISFMKRLGAVMPREVDEKVEIVEREMEHLKISQPLCFNVKAFGDCWKGSNCPNRHFISLDLDHGDLPDHGEVKVKILHVHSAQCFSVRLLEHKGKNGVMTPIPNSYWNIAVDLNKLFRDPETRYPASNLTVGDICAVKVGTNLFQRVRVDKIISSGYKSKPSSVRVTFMDEGSVKEYKDYALMALPKELQVLPPQAVEVYLCNVLPCDEDTVWNWSANEAMYNWVQENVAEEREGVYMVGKIVLTLGNTLWLDPFMARQHLEDLGNDVFIMSLRKELLKHGYAVDNPQHLEKLYSLCHDADIPVPCMSQKAETDQLNDQRYVVNEQQEDSVSLKEQEDSVSPKEQYLHTDMIKDEVITHNSPFKKNEVIKREKTLLNGSDKKRQALKPQWAFIPKDEWCPVLLRSAINPNEVFVQVEKFSESLERLSKDLQAHVQKQHVPVTPEIGLFCLGLFPEDNLWYRAQIVQITNDKKVELFFVDHGDFQFVDVDSLADITDTLINKLPFQAIECRLVGVKPKQDNIWSEAATDSLYHWSEIIGNLSVKVCTTGPATWTGTLKYGVVMVSGTGEAMSIVNQELVIDNNLGCEFLNEEIDYLDNLANPRQSLEVDENEQRDTDFLDEEEFDINFDDQESMAFMAKALGLPETLLITPEQQAPSTMKAIKMAPCLEKCSSQLVNESMESKPDGTCTPRDSVPTLSNCVRTPSVTWHQDTACVNVRIAVTDLRSYYVKCEPTRLQFRFKLGASLDLPCHQKLSPLHPLSPTLRKNPLIGWYPTAPHSSQVVVRGYPYKIQNIHQIYEELVSLVLPSRSSGEVSIEHAEETMPPVPRSRSYASQIFSPSFLTLSKHDSLTKADSISRSPSLTDCVICIGDINFPRVEDLNGIYLGNIAAPPSPSSSEEAKQLVGFVIPNPTRSSTTSDEQRTAIISGEEDETILLHSSPDTLKLEAPLAIL